MRSIGTAVRALGYQALAIDAASFRRALGQFASGVTVVSTRRQDGAPLAITVSAFCSVSLEPPLVLVCIGRGSEVNEALRSAGVFAVSVLAQGQDDWSRRFAEPDRTPEDAEGLPQDPHGCAFVPGSLAQLTCRIVSSHDAGDHTIFVGGVESASAVPGRPLVYHAGLYHRLDGGSPK